jgi:hypothetical protein
MSTRIRTLIVAVGIGALAWGAYVIWNIPSASVRLAVTARGGIAPQDVSAVLQGTERAAETLAALSTFDAFREDVMRSGFLVARGNRAGSPDQQRRRWERRVSVRRVGAQVLQVTALAGKREESRQLAEAAAHVLALRASQVAGDTALNVHVDRVRQPSVRASASFAAFLFGVGVTCFVFIVWVVLAPAWRVRRARERRDVLPVAPPRFDGGAPSFVARPSPDEARFWLQKFLERRQ